MPRRPRLAVALLGSAAAAAFTWLSFSWFEAEREVRILCSQFEAGDDVEDVMTTLATGHFLTHAPSPDGSGIEVWSRYTLGRSRCTMAAADGVVTGSRYRAPVRLERVAAWAAAALLAGLAGFQLLLASGAPLGRGAWGGGQVRLTPGLRAASAAAALFAAAGALVILEKAGIVVVLGLPGIVDTGVWLLVAAFAVSGVLNALSGSRMENRVGLPLALALAALCMVVGWSG